MAGMSKRFSALFMGLGLLAACQDSTTEPEETALFTVEVSGEQFRVKAEGEAAIAAMQSRLSSGTTGVISGTLVRGNGGFNGSWSWHLEPTTVTAPDLAIELCDGRPSFVEDDIDYWMNSVKQYCPWGAKVISRD
jgi:hypothetical protein